MDEPTYREWDMPPGGIRRWCLDCQNAGSIVVYRQYVNREGSSGTVAVQRECPTCGGRGSFAGAHPPV